MQKFAPLKIFGYTVYMCFVCEQVLRFSMTGGEIQEEMKAMAAGAAGTITIVVSLDTV